MNNELESQPLIPSEQTFLEHQKCESMIFAVGKIKDIKIFYSELPNTNCFVYAGVYIDNKLTFREHIECITKKVNKFSGHVKK